MEKTTIVAYREGCSLCDVILSASSEAALKEARIDHLAEHLKDYCEEEVEAGRAVRVLRDGKTLYRFNDDVETLDA